jgi:uncharacterized protein (DUF983 family)
MDSILFPAVPQPEMNVAHRGPGSQPVEGAPHAVIDNRTDLPDGVVQHAIEDRWVELAGMQFSQPSNFSLYATTNQGSMLARTPFRTPSNPIQEVQLARTVADTDDDVGAAIGELLAIAFGGGLMNQHSDEKTLEFFNQICEPTGLDLETTFEEMYREYLISGSITTLSLFLRQRLSYFPPKSDSPVAAQLQVPRVGILPAENLRVITNDILGQGELAYHVEDSNFKNWLNEYFNPRTPPLRKSIMAQEEPVMAALFTGRIQVPYNDGDPASRGLALFTLNQRMVHRTTMPKGAMPYPRPLLTRNFPLLEAKRLLNIMDYALLMGGTNYIVIAKKGSEKQPAQPGEVENLQNQIVHASRSGVLVGDHRLDIQIVTPNLEEMLNPSKRKLVGRKIAMGLLRQTEQVTGDAGTMGAENEMSLLARVVTSDRRKIIRHAHSTFYAETATRNRVVFKEGAPTIWAPPIILTGVKDFWANVIQASDRGLIPHRYTVEALGYDYDAAIAERERELARGDTLSLIPGKIPYSGGEPGDAENEEGNPGNPRGPQDANKGRPKGTSSNNGRGKDTPGQGKDRFAPNHVIRRTAGETVRAIVENDEVAYIGETTQALLEQYEGRMEFGYVTGSEREAIEQNQTIRAASSVIVPVNPAFDCVAFRTVKLDEGLRLVVGQRRHDDALVAKALRFSEPQFDLRKASEYALRWGFVTEPFVEAAGVKRCANCGNELPDYSTMNPVCPDCGADNTERDSGGSPVPSVPAEAPETTALLTKLVESGAARERTLTELLRDATARKRESEEQAVEMRCPTCGLLQNVEFDIMGEDCERCGEALGPASKSMLAFFEKKGVEPRRGTTPPAAASQPDFRQDESAWTNLASSEGATLLDEWAAGHHQRAKEKRT